MTTITRITTIEAAPPFNPLPTPAVIRIFAMLSVLAVALMAATLLLGLTMGSLHVSDLDPDTLRWATVHRLSGVAAALVVVLVNSISATYFIGTSRWCKEVTEVYRLDSQHVVRSAQGKRRAFFWAVLGMLTVVAVSALGAAADRTTGRPGTEHWVTPHLMGALLGVAVVAWSFMRQAELIRRQLEVIQQVLAEVQRIRTQRGLDR